MVKTYWIRHGATEWNINGRYLGGTDLPLNDTGRAEIKRLVSAYRRVRVERIYASPLQRARESAEQLARAWKCDVVMDDRLKELHFGAWEGLTTQEISQRYPRLWHEWLNLTVRGPFPGGGESFAVMQRRVASFIKEHMTPPATTIAVVAHGGVLRAAMTHLLSLPSSYYWMFQFGRASVTCLGHEDKRLWVEYLNRCYSDEAIAGVDEHA